MGETILIHLIRVAVIFVTFLGSVAYLVWLERKLLGHIQIRVGPKRVGPERPLQADWGGHDLQGKVEVRQSGSVPGAA